MEGAATLNYRGLLATQQGGSIPVEGFAYYFVREDGTGATAFGLYGKGALKPKSKLAQRLQHHAQHADQHPLMTPNPTDSHRRTRDHHHLRHPPVPARPWRLSVPGSTRSPAPSSAPARRRRRAPAELCAAARRAGRVVQPGDLADAAGVGPAPQTYRWALGVGILIPVVAGALGFLAFAFVAAAVVVPAIYVVYMYDVNQWEDQPLGVVLGAVGAAAALGVGFTFLWHAGILGDDMAPVDFDGNGTTGVRWTSLLVLVLLVPDRERGPQAGRAAGAGQPAGLRRHDRRPDLRCRRGCGVRGSRDDRGQPRAVQQLRPGRLTRTRASGSR